MYLRAIMISTTKVRFKAIPANSPSLFPEDILSKIPENHPVKLVNEVVEGLDIDCILSEYKGGGTSSFHPRMMIKILFYAYLNNVYSCRKIAQALRSNIYFMWLSGNSLPDYRTINYFRGKRLKNHIHKLFAEVVRMLQELGYVSLKTQYIDGTKIEATSGRYTFVWRANTERYKKNLENKIEKILSDIDSQIKDDQTEIDKTETSKAIDSQALKEKLSEINSKLKESDKAIERQVSTLQNKHLPKLEQYEKQLETLGERNSYSKTDEDATFMRMKDDHLGNGQLKAAYNVQISTEEQFITHYSIHQKPGDTTTLTSHLDGFEQNNAAQSEEVIADAGYGSEENYEMMESQSIEAYVKYNTFDKEQKKSYKNNPFLVSNLFYNAEKDFYVCPMGQHMNKVGEGTRQSYNGYISKVVYYEAQHCVGCSLRGLCYKGQKGNRRIEVNHRLKELRQAARDRLNSELGKAHRIKRSIEVESVFGQIKSNNHFNRFTLRGLDKVEIEFGLMALGHNLRKLVRQQGKLTKKDIFPIVYSCFLTLDETQNQKMSFSTSESYFYKPSLKLAA